MTTLPHIFVAGEEKPATGPRRTARSPAGERPGPQSRPADLRSRRGGSGPFSPTTKGPT